MASSVDRLMRLSEVRGVVGYSRTTIYRKMSTGEFPLSVRLGEKAVAWRESDVQAWIASRQPSELPRYPGAMEHRAAA